MCPIILVGTCSGWQSTSEEEAKWESSRNLQKDDSSLNLWVNTTKTYTRKVKLLTSGQKVTQEP
jgi:hypothetical protein